MGKNRTQLPFKSCQSRQNIMRIDEVFLEAGDGLCSLRKSPFQVMEFSESVRPNEHGSEEPRRCELSFWNLSLMGISRSQREDK